MRSAVVLGGLMAGMTLTGVALSGCGQAVEALQRLQTALQWLGSNLNMVQTGLPLLVTHFCTFSTPFPVS